MIKYGTKLTDEQYYRIYFDGRTLLNHTEIQEVYKVYNELTGESPCNTCPSTVQSVIDDIINLRNGHTTIIKEAIKDRSPEVKKELIKKIINKGKKK